MSGVMKALCWLPLATMTLLAQDMTAARMMRGDDPRWADPAFDDRGWETVGQRQVRPMEDSRENRLWLRLRVSVPSAEPAAVLVYRCPCEVYLDGVRLGATGNLDLPRPRTTGDSHVFPVPAPLAGKTALLAVRQYHPPGIEAALGFTIWQNIRMLESREVGTVGDKIRRSVEFPYVFRLSFLLLALGGLLAAAAGQRRDPLVLGLFAYVFSQSWMTVLPLFMPLPYADNLAWIWLVGMGVIPALVFVQWHLAGLPVNRMAGGLAFAAYLALRAPWTAGLFLARPATWTPLAVAVFLLPSLMALAMLGYAAGKAWSRSEWPLRILLLAGPATGLLNLSARLASQGWAPALSLPLGDFSLNGDTLATLAFTSLATAYVVRNARERRAEEQRLRSEMESAQTVQALLLSQAMPTGVEAIYLPASEVGGDFYQAFATSSGTLVVVGDVSGKGLQAAMRVSAIVGALRNRRSDEPALVLAELNAVLSGSPGFTTCCCALLPAGDGPARLANAGHPAPYVDGVEWELEPALPLGVTQDASYVEQSVTGSSFTFVSDGVLEAADAQGELFGFDRTRDLSLRPAAEIAAAAQQWGQNDDITVVTVRRTTS